MIRKMLLIAAAGALAACQQGAGAGNDQAAAPEPPAGSSAGGNAAGAASRTIADGFAQSPEHRRLNEAVEAAGFSETLRGAGPYTVFAPTDAALDALPEEERAALMSPEQRERLGSLLSYHIVPGTVMAQDIGVAIDRAGGRAELATVAGPTLSAARDGDAILITDGAGNRARVVRADELRSNGVVHSVDAVLMPERR
ncbi:MAG: fasciclin domain-containing protein [Allosphingosinicella sp.]|uniref:fasciclin domain-containing protein n=1 Tax=Allosphingosinicella sp. TaxID=2823234 RepID=UPI0039448138